MAMIQVYNKLTGEPVEHPVPEHWLDNPALGGNLSRTRPSAAAILSAAARSEAPAEVPDKKKEA